MLPVEFDFRILSTLPLPSDETIAGILKMLRTLLVRKVLPYFKLRKGTDPLKLARAEETLSIARLEDEENRIRTVSMIIRTDKDWTIKIHERIFDYLAFVVPSDPNSRLGDGTVEEHKMLAFTELMLRHEVEHMLYPERRECDVVASDVEFAMERRNEDPTFYRVLRGVLSDEMNGIKGDNYLALLDEAEKGLPHENRINSILGALVIALAEAPQWSLLEVFPLLDLELKARVLGEYYRRSLSTSYSLLRRTRSLRSMLNLFSLLLKANEKEALEVFHTFKDRWGLVGLFHELDLPEAAVDEKAPEEIFQLLKTTLRTFMEEEETSTPAGRIAPQAAAPSLAKPPGESVKSLKDRIDEAHNNPLFPKRVIEVIDKNKLNTVGHSGSKYSELLETLLAIPWRKIKKIEVTPEAFEQGLHRSHYGLEIPKEIVCDFFTNLIWRYESFTDEEASSWRHTGSAFLLVGPPGVGKTSLAISIAKNLGIPYHKISLGGMRDEADIRGHGFTYEGSKPGAIVQGLIKMEAMNGLFILDEADKTEKFAIATLLEILDPEQNHLFHDKYTETTVDIDLSNCHFFLTANTLEAVPQVVVNRCEVIHLDRYSVEEKIAIARKYLIGRIRRKYQIGEEKIFFDPETEPDLLRHLIRAYTYEAGVRELERIIRTLFLRVQRKEILTGVKSSVRITREKIKEYLKEPIRPRQINEKDGVGEMMGLGVDVERGVGSVMPIQVTRIAGADGVAGSRGGYLSIVHATGNIEKVMDESRKVAMTGILGRAEELKIDLKHLDDPIHLHFMGGSTKKDGPSAGGAIALALASILSGSKIRRDVAMTGEIDTKGRITAVGALAVKIETAHDAGCRTVIIPKENLYGEGGIERLPEALKRELQILTFEQWNGVHEPFDYSNHILQVVAVDDVVQAAGVAAIDEEELKSVEGLFDEYAREVARLLGERLRRPEACFQVVQVKTTEEMGTDGAPWGIPEAGSRLVLLPLPEVRDTARARADRWGAHVRVRAFDPGEEQLIDLVKELRESHGTDSGRACTVALVAPYYLLMRDSIRPLEGLTLFANNFTLQTVKIKGCKNLLDRVFCLLSLLDPSRLESCPFVGTMNGIHVLDISFIPEKYRLDLRRAEEIAISTLGRWADSVMELFRHG
jgi:ATP-dependent Lon protease